MTEVIGVRFKKVGKVYYFDPCGIQVEKEMPVIVETARGLEYGDVAMANSPVEDTRIVQPLKKLVRIATENDRKTMEQNLQFEKDAFRICEEKIAKHKLEMKLVSVEYTFDHSKILFYFSADGRVDFRELVKDLAGVFRTRIELRQIGVRDEAKMIGGLGICGRPLCCSSFLESFQPVSINMAKDQGLSLNPTKISGTCGRLMCCLKYENEAYQDLIRQTPPNESLVDTPYGRGTVIDSSLLRCTCRVRMQNSPDTPVCVNCSECTVLRRGRDKGEPMPDLPAPPTPTRPLPNDRSRAFPAAAPEANAADAPQSAAPAEARPPRPDNRKPRRPDNRKGGKPDGKPRDSKPFEGKPRGDKPENRPDRPKGDKRPQQDRPKGDRRPPQDKQRPQGEPRKEHPVQQGGKPEGAPAAEGGEKKPRTHRGGRRGGHRSGSRPASGEQKPPVKPEN